ncbi:MAG: ABC transporter permease [Bacteroidales bacterium]|uniref:ABC transporter permease n=1 Tax=Porphyromonas sp. TaxID=1924944 RepID=UPI002975CC15|nr:ABC transporter permease [Porphyromonas sp.]MDD7437912.1 ABC transporter permease [Bacteroidales bacterium]MDY3067149.1 ABC transporter permease [Porphyromonas sp.]
MKRFIQQTLKLWQDNPLYSGIVVLATALIITFCMMLYMVYALQTNDLAPENNRSRILRSTSGYSWNDRLQADYNTGMSSVVAKAIFENLDGVEEVSYTTNYRMSGNSVHAGTSRDNSYSRTYMRVDDAYFRIYNYRFVAGAPFTKEQSEANRMEVIITDKLANALYGTTDVVGKTINIAREENKIVGVVKSVSSIFPNSYSEIWRTFDPSDFDWHDRAKDLRGGIMVTLLLKKGYPKAEVARQVAERVEAYNANRLDDYVFSVGVEDIDKIQIEVGSDVRNYWKGTVRKFNGGILIAVLIAIILLIPAVNMAGIHSSQIEKRIAEVGVRKSYGASSRRIMWQFFNENLMLTLVGGLLGLLFSFIAIQALKDRLLATSINFFATADDFTIPWKFFFSPQLFVVLLVFCLLVNTLSAIIPIWRAMRTPIVETLKSV